MALFGVRRSLLKRPAIVSASFDAATTAWINAVVTAGGTVSTAQKGFVDTLVRALKANSTFSLMSRLWLHASENTQQATIDLINLGVATPHNSPTFTASQGFTGDGAAAYLDTGFQHDSNFSQNSGSVGSYVMNARTATLDVETIGNFATATSSGTLIRPKHSSGFMQYEVNGSVLVNAAVAPPNGQGFWIATRDGSTTNILAYQNGSLYDTSGTDNSFAPVAFNFHILAVNIDGTASQFSPDQVAISFIGAGLSGTQVASLSGDLNSYMTSLGTNVY